MVRSLFILISLLLLVVAPRPVQAEGEKIAEVLIVPAYSDEKIHVYLARGLTPAVQRLDRDEILQVENHRMEELVRMVCDGAISDVLDFTATGFTFVSDSDGGADALRPRAAAELDGPAV